MADLPYSFDLTLDNDADSKNIDYHKNIACESNELFHEHKISFTDSETHLSAEQRLSLLNFFFVKTLSEKEFRDAYLKKVHWITSDDKPDASALYTSLLKVAGLTDSIYFTSKISHSNLEAFGFYRFNPSSIKNGVASCCVEHPRAILEREIPPLTAKMDNNMKVNVSFKDNKEVEPKIQCLFRHLRNAIAHDNTYFIGDKVLFVDYDRSGKETTAAVLLYQQTLFNWITLVNSGRTHTGYVLGFNSDSKVVLQKIDEHPLLMKPDFNLMIKTTAIKIEKKVAGKKTSSWVDTTEIKLSVQEELKSVSGITVSETSSTETVIGNVINETHSTGEFRITIPMRFSSLQEKDTRDDKMFLFISY